MPTEIYIAVLVACAALVILTVLSLVVAVYLARKLNGMVTSVAEAQRELRELIGESREGVKELRQSAARIAGPMEDIEHITRTARGWTDRADRLVDAVGVIAEPPIFFAARNIATAGRVVSGMLEVLFQPKR